MSQFVITGVTVTGNMGGAAMLFAAVDALSARFPGSTFRLLSIRPATDRAEGLKNVEIIDARPIRLILLYLPIALLVWPFASLPSVRRLLASSAYFRALLESTVVIDLCGIAFADRRGLPLLVYNIACCLPAIAMGTPVAKLAQALGPFCTMLNRMAARFILSRCAVVVARGQTTLTHLRNLGIAGAVSLPDVSFIMKIGPDEKAKAAQLTNFPADGRRLLIVSPSEVVNRLLRKGHASFADAFCGFLERCIADGWRVAVIPHSFGSRRSKNNDLTVSELIVDRLASAHVTLLRLDEDPRLLRAILGRADIFVGCRFHSVVGALAMGVPTLTIGWSHKYGEMVEMLQPGDWILDWREFTAEAAWRRFEALVAQRDAIAAGIQMRLGEVRRRAGENLDLAVGAMRP